MDLIKQMKQPIVFTFKPENIEEMHINYYKRYETNPWRARVSFTKENITSEVKFEAEEYKELFEKINNFLSRL